MSDIIAITDSNKNIVAEYRYDPWGKVLDEENLTEIGELNPFRYRSYYYDSDIKMYYLQSRYYDAEVGRFINCDDVNYIGITELELSYNPFSYCENEPVNDSDPFGKITAKAFLGLIKLTKSIYNNFLCVRLYVWGFLNRAKNKTYDFSKKWEKLLVKRLSKSKAIKNAIEKAKNNIKSHRLQSYEYSPKINFYNYLKQSVSDIDLILSIGGGGNIRLKVENTYKSKKGKTIYNVTVELKNEVFDFGYWKFNIFNFQFGEEEPHSKNALVKLINNVGYYTQAIGAFVYYTWGFSVSFTTT